jgi:predicted Zn-dependent protease
VDGRYSAATIDGIHQTDTSAGSGHAASIRLGDLSGAAVGSLAAQRALDSADAYDFQPGEYEVVFAPEAVASIAIFLAAYGLQAKAHVEGQSFAELGTQQFDESFSLFDDATDPRAIGLWFDSEGTVRKRMALVDGGVTTGLAHDRRTAYKAGVESTGHAYPGSEVWGPMADALFVSNGTEDVESLIRDVERGLYISTFNYCRVLEPKSLVVTGLTRNGTFMIENGTITGAVTNLRFTQSFVDGLGPGVVLGVGNDARHADSEFGANVVHTPSLRLASWAFTGGAAG